MSWSRAIRNILLLSVWDRLYTSESDVHRRQILTCKDGRRAERVNASHSLHLFLKTSLFCMSYTITQSLFHTEYRTQVPSGYSSVKARNSDYYPDIDFLYER